MADDDDGAAQSLRSRLAAAESFCLGLERMDSGEAGVQARVAACTVDLEELTRHVARLSLFSANECYKEAEVRSLPYLLLPALLGHLTLHVGGMENRKEALDSAEIYLKDYLTRVKSYELIGEHLPWACDDDEGGAPACSTAAKAGDPVKLRERKIAKLKESQRLEEAIRRLEKLGEDADDGDLRELYVAKLRRWANTAFDRLREIDMERPMVEMMAERRAHPSTASQDDNRRRPPAPHLRPIILTRDAVQKAVFGAGYPAVATMTVAEWYDQMSKEGWFHRHGNGGGGGGALTETDAGGEEERRRRQMAWDDYVDENPRGHGNTLNKG